MPEMSPLVKRTKSRSSFSGSKLQPSLFSKKDKKSALLMDSSLSWSTSAKTASTDVFFCPGLTLEKLEHVGGQPVEQELLLLLQKAAAARHQGVHLVEAEVEGVGLHLEFPCLQVDEGLQSLVHLIAEIGDLSADRLDLVPGRLHKFTSLINLLPDVLGAEEVLDGNGLCILFCLLDLGLDVDQGVRHLVDVSLQGGFLRIYLLPPLLRFLEPLPGYLLLPGDAHSHLEPLEFLLRHTSVGIRKLLQDPGHDIRRETNTELSLCI
mmetsp:Transcript_12255/g.28079  ORF Transcript_12255/g.28079 Transcript_12255/m.28079 type:complete len:265 (+) Transcript_12255:575-1369(+)